MPSRTKRRKRASSPRLLGRESQSRLWSRFRHESLNNALRRRLFREQLLDNHASLSIPGPCSHREVVERIAGGAKKPIAIDYLCPEFGGTVHGRGRVVFGSPGKYFDEIASNYPDLQWSLSEKGLRIEIFGGTERASSFDEVAGHLMIQARAKLDGKYLKPSDYQAIAKKLDEAGFEMPDYLQGSFRKELAQWNQRHPGKRSKPFTPRSTLNNPSDLGAVSA